MATKLEKLFFAIGLKDEASGKAGKLQKNLERMTKGVQKHFKGVGVAGAGVAGAVLSVQALADPAIDLNRALGEVSSLDVDKMGLKAVQNAAGDFAFAYGGMASDVVRASYDIQSAIAGLTGNELASFTGAGAVLAKATKADVGTITSYIGTMYGIYEAQAAKMGKARWVDQLAGRTAYAVQIFKTSGTNMSAAFTALGANAEVAGVQAAEQMAVLGMLQATMGGSEAGTKYKAFLRGVAGAQKQLGLSFTDSHGRMLSMVAILEKIRGKFGDNLTVDQAAQLKKAFGSDEASGLINLMLKQTGALKKNIADIGNIKGMEHAEKMAKRQVDAFMRWGGAANYVRANFMQKLTPALERWTNKGVESLATLNTWIDKYPNVARVVGYLMLAIVSLTGVVALATVAYHVYKLASIALMAQSKGLLMIVKLLGAGFLKLAAVIYANPIVLVIAGIALAIGLLIWKWGALKAYLADTTWGAPLLWVMDKIEGKWAMVTDLFSDFTWTKLLKLVVSTALMPLEAFVNSIGSLLDKVGLEMGASLKNWKASEFADAMLAPGGPGMSFTPAGMAAAAGANMAAASQPQQVDSLQAPRRLQVKQGGILGGITNNTRNSGQTITVGEQHFHIENAPADLNELAALYMN